MSIIGSLGGKPRRQLSTVLKSPHYDDIACRAVDRVYVDDVYIPQCVAYDMDAGWAFGKDYKGIWAPKVYGVVRVVLK